MVDLFPNGFFDEKSPEFLGHLESCPPDETISGLKGSKELLDGSAGPRATPGPLFSMFFLWGLEGSETEKGTNHASLNLVGFC